MSDLLADFHAALRDCPIVAILRGLTPDEAPAVGDALVAAGVRIIEVPLNSPDPYDSIAILAKRLQGQALVGAGTVLSVDQVQAVCDAGGQLIVSPNVNAHVITETCKAGAVSIPGFFTPTEAFAALSAGAHALKLFPAEGASPPYLRAMRAVLPTQTPVCVVGGVTPDKIGAWLDAGANGFGLGSYLYRGGKPAADVGKDARAFIDALRAVA